MVYSRLKSKRLFFQQNTVSNPSGLLSFFTKVTNHSAFWADLIHRKLHLGWFQPQLLKFPGIPASFLKFSLI